MALALPLAGCTLARLDVEVKDFDASTVLVGRVEAGGTTPGPVVVGAWAHEGPLWRLAHQTRLHEPGGYELIVPHGRYRLFAFADRDGNGLHDAGEPVGSLLRVAAGEDDAVGQNFLFGALPAGEYELTIVADSHAVHRSLHRVVPGEPPPIVAIRLEDER